MLKPALMRHFQEYADSHKHPMNRLTHKCNNLFSDFWA